MEEKDNNVADKLFIAELIRKVHDELIRSQEIRENEGKAPLFTVKDLTIEVNFIATETLNKEGGLDFKIITAGANKQYSAQQIHRIVLNLELNKKLSDNQNKSNPVTKFIQEQTAVQFPDNIGRNKDIGINPVIVKEINPLPSSQFGERNKLDDDPSHI